jgi:glycosyltransferase involved in cell wall biosynthesis
LSQASYTADAAELTERLDVRLDAPLPSELSVGAGTALFVCGTCFCRDAKVSSLSFVVDGVEQPVIAHGMPRLDLFRSLHPGLDPFATSGIASDPFSSQDPFLHSYRSGFWGIVRVTGRAASGACELLLRVRLADGSQLTTEIARIPFTGEGEPVPMHAPDPATEPLIAICMATFDPPIELFERQIESIRGQTHRNWICIVSDDCSTPKRFEALREVLGEDPRFIVSRSARRRGFYLNFERALAMVPPSADYVALADQDDRWYPEKLKTLLEAIGGAQLAYSDSRVINRDCELISDTYWSRRRNNHTDLLSLLVANSVTGAASLFPRELLEYALPFPPAQFAHYHDHWIALTALSLGEIAFVERPLYDYVQHARATLGHEAANRTLALRERLRSIRGDSHERVRMWRLHYFVDVSRLNVCATILQMRCGTRMAPGKRRTLERFLRTDSSLLAVVDLWRRGACELVGRPETLGAESMLAYAFFWRRLLAASARDRPVRGLRLDAVPPLDLELMPSLRAPDTPTVRAVAEKIGPLPFVTSQDAPRRVNILIPTIDLEHFFGGYIGKFNLARRLADRGLRVRIVTTDPVGPLPGSWKQTLESYSGLAGLMGRIELSFGRDANEINVSRTDAFIASTWWTAHIAHSAATTLGHERFLYLIQEYEPFTFPMGTYAALASESYRFPHYAIFSTELLRDYFRRHAIGVFADGAEAGETRSIAFQNAITAIDSPSAAEIAQRATRKLLFYARPEPHASRNMFELGVLALERAVESGAFHGWELHGIGAVEGVRGIALDDSTTLELLPRSDQGSYAKLLRDHDIGLALMYTPHPSLVPIEMASAGLLTVTNSFENKTHDALAAISSNLIAAEPTIGGVSAALITAAEQVEDYERRASGSAVRWSRDWDQSYHDELLDRVATFVESC